ncbi:MAG TPA: hypothetical protein VGO21_04130, partial [Candidatus Paceibacterota bacterium]|nr:hypothetical protein [Candidatus Paceibacterota bacterium]
MEKDKKIQHEVAHTFAEDMAKVIEDDSGGLVRKIIHEEEEHEIEKKNLSPESRKNKILMLVSLVFTLVAVSTLFFFLFRKNTNTVAIEAQFIPIIFNDKTDFLEVKDLKKDEIAQTVQNEVNATIVKNGGVEGIYPTEDKKVVGLREFLKHIESNFVPGNVNFVSDNFLMGVMNGKTKDFFILLKVRSLPDVFDPLHAWENKMFFDLHGFFGVDISPQTNYLLTKDFNDGI